MITTRHWLLVTAAIVAVSAGCKSKNGETFQDPFFPAEGTTPSTKTMFQTQYNAGAAEDGMLFPIHFDGEALNSLGKQKLKNMLAGKRGTGPMKLYLNLNKDASDNAARQASVEAAFKDAGLATDQYALAIGPNPGALRPAAAGVKALTSGHEENGDASVSGTSNNLPVAPK